MVQAQWASGVAGAERELARATGGHWEVWADWCVHAFSGARIWKPWNLILHSGAEVT